MKYSITLILSLLCSMAIAQSVTFKALRFDEDYSKSDQMAGNNWYHRFKFHPITSDGSAYLSFGGEVRSQYFYYKDQNWGESPPDHDGFILSRTLFHADLHIGKYIRTFVQVQSSLSNGELAPPSPVNQNPLDLHQAFIDVQFPLEKNTALTLRLGRQELLYGSQRLVSVRDAPNNRQAFDGAKVIYNSKLVSFEGFYTNYVAARPGIFDDKPTADTKFRGGYAVLKDVPLVKHLDLYYLGLKKRLALFDDGKGREVRHSIGARLWNTGEKWQYDVEGVYQFGKFGSGSISAYTISSNIAYTFKSLTLRPQAGVKGEVISGDKHYDDGRLSTFNPLFPRGGYFGLAALIGPSNLFDMHPYVQISLSPHLTLTEDYDVFWRLNQNDGLYAISGRLLYSGKNGFSKYIGGQLGTTLEYNPTNFLYMRAEFTWFDSGKYLKEAGPGKDILMTGLTITYKF